jgi:hypothetical protein
MLRRLRETAPAGLVPLAWGFAAAAHLELLTARAVLIGHLVMTAVLVAFAALSYTEMRRDPVLRLWLGVVVAGVPVTLAGAYGVAAANDSAARAAVFGWMLLPAAALVPTARTLGLSSRAYGAAAALTAVGAVLFLAAPLVGGPLTLLAMALAGAGQTLSILTAVREPRTAPP